MNTAFVTTIQNLVATYNPGNGAAPQALPTALLQALFSAGAWNPATNTPPLASGQGAPGAAFLCSGVGTYNLDGITTWAANDYAVFVPNSNKWIRINGATGEVSNTNIADQINAAMIAGAAGNKTVTGQHTMLSASDTVVTGLALVASVVAIMESDEILTFNSVSAQKGDQAGSPAAGSIVLKGWMPTDSTHPAPVAATGWSGIKVNWIAVGT